MTSAPDDAATIATQPASLRERRFAIALVFVLVLLSVVSILVSHGPGYDFPAFVAAYAGCTAMADALATALLFVLYRTEGRRDVLLAAIAYLLNTLIIAPYALTFPDLVGAQPPFSNLQTTAFLYFCWHATFAVAIILGFALRHKDEGYRPATLATFVLSAVAVAAAIASFATIGRNVVPMLAVASGHFTWLFAILLSADSILALAGAVFVARGGTLSSLRLWLAIALVASALDTTLNLLSPGRFSPAWYAGKLEQFVTASVVLVSLLSAWSQSQVRANALALRLVNAHEQRRRLQDDFDREHRASQAFQQAALPSLLPIVPGLAFAALYRAANRDVMVGGDWYDAFRIDDGRIVLSVGDVMGSGLSAAVTMNAVRQSVRGAAQLHPDPIAILNAADRALRSERPDSIVTAFVAVVDPVTRILSYASAGHPPALLRTAAGETRVLAGSGLPLGIRSMVTHAEREPAHTIELPDPSMLVLYTDGLTEVDRDVVGGESRLVEFVSGESIMRVADPAAAIADALIEKPQDDVAIVTMLVDGRFRANADEASEGIRWTFASADAFRFARTRDDVAKHLVALGAGEEDLANANLILSELVGNVFRHARGDVTVALDISGASPVLHVLDRGTGFTFVSRLPASMLSESGRGLFVVSQLADDFSVVGRLGGGSHARAVLPFQPTRGTL